MSERPLSSAASRSLSSNRDGPSGITGATSGPIASCFAILAWRDVAVRYKQTVIGVAWAVVRPFLTMVVFTIVFGRLAELPSESAAPYPVMVFAGMLPWFLFSTILERGIGQPRRQRQPDRQGLFPAHHHPVRRRRSSRWSISPSTS